jgi:hypothetical protein
MCANKQAIPVSITHPPPTGPCRGCWPGFAKACPGTSQRTVAAVGLLSGQTRAIGPCAAHAQAGCWLGPKLFPKSGGRGSLVKVALRRGVLGWREGRGLDLCGPGAFGRWRPRQRHGKGVNGCIRDEVGKTFPRMTLRKKFEKKFGAVGSQAPLPLCPNRTCLSLPSTQPSRYAKQ